MDDAVRQLKWKNNAGGQIVDLNKNILKLKELIYNREKKFQEQENIKSQIVKIDELIKEKNNLRLRLNDLKLLGKLNKIKMIVNLMNERNILRNQIETENINYEKAKEIVYICFEQEKEIKILENDIKELKKDLKSSVGYQINEEEINDLNFHMKKKEELEYILNNLDKVVLQEANVLKNNYLLYKQEANKLEMMKKESLSLEKYINQYEEFKIQLDQLEVKRASIEGEFDKKKEKMNSENEKCILEEEKLKTSRMKYFKYFIIFIIIFCILGGLGLILNRFLIFWISFAFTAVGILYFELLNKKLKNKMVDVSKERERLQKDFLDLVINTKNEISNKINQVNDKINYLNKYVNKYKDIELSQITLCRDLDSRKDYININFKRLKSNLKDLLLKIQIFNFNIDEFLMSEEIEIQVKKIYEFVAEKIKMEEDYLNKRLYDKKCESYEEFIRKYNSCLKNHGLIKLIDSKEGILNYKKCEFLRKMSLLENTKTYQDAVLKLSTMICVVKEEENKNSEIKALLKSLDIKYDSIELLKKMSLKVEEDISCNIKNLNMSDIEISSAEKRIKILDEMKLEEKKDELKYKTEVFSESVSELKERLSDMEERLRKKEIYLKSLDTAKEVLNESYNELKDKISPRINKEASFIFKSLTDNKYDSLFVQEDRGMLVKDGAFNRNCSVFSSGTIDQAYLSLRLAISCIISGNEPIPVLIDDVLVRYDDERLLLAFKYLKSHSQNYNTQIIIFTCHNYITAFAKKMGIELINL